MIASDQGIGKVSVSSGPSRAQSCAQFMGVQRGRVITDGLYSEGPVPLKQKLPQKPVLSQFIWRESFAVYLTRFGDDVSHRGDDCAPCSSKTRLRECLVTDDNNFLLHVTFIYSLKISCLVLFNSEILFTKKTHYVV